jgi:hypothetical protein
MVMVYPHLILNCKQCGSPMWLLADMIQPLFAYPVAQANRFHAIAVACENCKSVNTYILHEDFPNHNPKDTVIGAEPLLRDVVQLESLVCEEEGCKTRLPLFALWSPAISIEERIADIGTWHWENMRCPLGHPIPRPAEHFPLPSKKRP